MTKFCKICNNVIVFDFINRELCEKCKRENKRKYDKEYFSRREVKDRRNKRARIRRKRPDVKKKKSIYNAKYRERMKNNAIVAESGLK